VQEMLYFVLPLEIFQEIDHDDVNTTNQIPISFEIPSRKLYTVFENLFILSNVIGFYAHMN